ncbi:MAG TPA: hypothetical protein VHC97_02540 [Thermoanaerobaculia bacterium]|jgi:hypothetical protein|nr:hypothetical protein [Thermoanaerobaculia bacterium]
MGTTCSSLDVLLKEAFHSYRQGLLRLPTFSFPFRNLSTILFLNSLERIALKERVELHRLSSACKEGLDAARQGQLEAASCHFERAQVHLDAMAKGGRLAWLLGVSTYQAGIAYLDFKNGFPEESRRRLDWAMDANLELELSGLLFMQVRRIQQGHNLARMDFLLSRRSIAIELAGDLVAYMEGRIHKLNYHCDWRPKFLQKVPKDSLRFLIREVVGETAGRIVTGGSSEEEWRILIGASRLCQSPDATIFPQAQYALLAQSKRLSDKPEDYLYNLNRFFGIGIRHCHLLWYAIMVEFVNFCGEMDTDYSRQIQEVIKRDSLKWKEFPLFFRAPLMGTEI